MKRVCFVVPHFYANPGGGYRVIYEYANQLCHRGYDVTVVYSEHLPTWDLRLNLCQKLRLGWIRFKDNTFARKIAWTALDRKIRVRFVHEPVAGAVPDGDIIFATFWPIADCIKDFPDSKGRKFYLVQDFGDYFGSQKRLEETWKLPFVKVTISRWLYENVAVVDGPDNVVHIPIGINHSVFKMTDAIDNRPSRVTAFFSASPYKSARDCVKAFEICASHNRNFKPAMFGSALLPADLRSSIEYHRRISDGMLAALYNDSKIFVCSSQKEGFALPPAEAMACGCAVVSTDCGGNRDYAEDGVTALVSPPNDPESLARNILRLLDDEPLRIKIARAGHERIQLFKWEASADKLEALFRKYAE